MLRRAKAEDSPDAARAAREWRRRGARQRLLTLLQRIPIFLLIPVILVTAFASSWDGVVWLAWEMGGRCPRAGR